MVIGPYAEVSVRTKFLQKRRVAFYPQHAFVLLGQLIQAHDGQHQHADNGEDAHHTLYQNGKGQGKRCKHIPTSLPAQQGQD